MKAPMNPKELRYGNLIVRDDGGCFIYQIEKRYRNVWRINDIDIDFDNPKESDRLCSPLPIVGDRLKEYGFYKERTGNRLTIQAWSSGHPGQRFNIDFKDGKILLISRYQGDSDHLTMEHIKYFHHVQNLYQSLSGEELKKEEKKETTK